jgi:hypothetical protein
VALVEQAETNCQDDPSMKDAAGMVYVGDVYSLYAAADKAVNTESVSDELWPFIR